MARRKACGLVTACYCCCYYRLAAAASGCDEQPAAAIFVWTRKIFRSSACTALSFGGRHTRTSHCNRQEWPCGGPAFTDGRLFLRAQPRPSTVGARARRPGSQQRHGFWTVVEQLCRRQRHYQQHHLVAAEVASRYGRDGICEQVREDPRRPCVKRLCGCLRGRRMALERTRARGVDRLFLE